MKAILILLLLIICVSSQFGQDLSKQDKELWNVMVTSLSNENWDPAFTAATQLLEHIKTEDEDKSLAKLRYMYLYSAAGRVLSKKMSFDELEKVIQPFVGKEVAFPFRRVIERCGGSNLNFVCVPTDDKTKLLVPATNQKATTILAFEYYTFKEDPHLERHTGKYVSFLGTVTKIEPNPNRSDLIILRIYVENATVFAVN